MEVAARIEADASVLQRPSDSALMEVQTDCTMHTGMALLFLMKFEAIWTRFETK